MVTKVSQDVVFSANGHSVIAHKRLRLMVSLASIVNSVVLILPIGFAN